MVVLSVSHIWISAKLSGINTSFQKRYSCTFLLFFFSAILLLFSCSHHHQRLQVIPSSHSLRIDGTLDFVLPNSSAKTSIFIEIADTPDAWKKGLMGRQNLDFEHGMLFVFDQIKPRKFWMKNTPIPLDIIFIGKDGCVVNIAESAEPLSDKHYESKGPIKYAVEVRAGFARRFNIDVDTCIQWQRR
jgi:uncharacterized protein